MNIYMQSLGCSKNQVDSEMILGLCKNLNMTIVKDYSIADLIIVNTCGFIESAKQEAIDTILELSDSKKSSAKLVVCGCLAQRYKKDLIESLPEIDLIISIDEYSSFTQIISKLMNIDFIPCTMNHLQRVYESQPFMRYVKISEGCLNKCAYCAIPLIRGTLKSREIEDIVNEVKLHVLDGVKEINIISQDTTIYGYDIYNEKAIVKLLSEIVKIEGDFRVRLLYLYPDIISDELILFIKNNDKIMPYFDIPIQHSENKILSYMFRRGSKEYLLELFKKIRYHIPHSIIRTTIIAGFNYETDEDFNNLIDFITEVKFDRLGTFPFSLEDDTYATKYDGVVSEDVKISRYNKIMEVQSYISLNLNLAKIGKVYDCIIEGYDYENYMYTGRSFEFAPDDIDGIIYIASINELKVGDVVKAKILDVDAYNLTAEEVYEEN